MTMPGPHGEQRIIPALPVTAVKTFGFAAPLATHWRPAKSCEEAECDQYLNGWQTVVPADSEAALYIRQASGRAFTEERPGDGLVMFTFPPGQDCFRLASHRVPLGRPEQFFEYGGDWRGQTSPARPHSAQGWLDAFGEHQERVKEQIERG